MSTDTDEEAQLEKAAILCVRHTTLSVRQCLILAGFSELRSKGRALQMRVSRSPEVAAAKAKKERATQNTAVELCVTPETSSPLYPPPEAPVFRNGSKEKQSQSVHDKNMSRHKNSAFKRATSLFAEQAKKPKKQRWSANQVKDYIETEFGKGHSPSARRIQQYVKDGLVGVSPLKSGRRSEIANFTFRTLINAVETFVVINQLNGRGGRMTKRVLSAKIKAVLGDAVYCSSRMLGRVMQETTIDLMADVVHTAEQRRIQWTTYNNIKMWFENWENDLVELGFAFRDEKGDVIIPKEQMRRILNVDESCLSLDGSKGARGGRPEVVFFDPRFPQLGAGTSKSSVTSTLIAGSTAAGEPVPPHFQFSSKAQTVEGERIRNEFVKHTRTTKGKFGRSDCIEHPVTVGLNLKGGMDDEEFQQYIFNSIVPLYPDACDRPGKRVMLKVDSGPGRLSPALLALLRFHGFYLYPGVPNTTAVSQETDRNYGPMKTGFRINLKDVVDERIAKDVSVSLAPYLVGLILFGGTDPETNLVIEKNAFAESFDEESNLRAWFKIGAAVVVEGGDGEGCVTRSCLWDRQVRREKGDSDDDTNRDMILIQEANDLAVYLLNARGYPGDRLKAKINEAKFKRPVTAPHSKERIELLSSAATHGSKFLATGGGHVTSDDFFKSLEVKDWKAKIKVLENEKIARLARLAVARKGQEALNAYTRGNIDILSRGMKKEWVDALLDWYEVPNSEGCHYIADRRKNGKTYVQTHHPLMCRGQMQTRRNWRI